MITAEKEAIALLLEIQKDDYAETAHVTADRVLCDLLRELGYGNVVEEYEKIDKWYS